MGGRWLEGGSVVSWAGLLPVRQVEEGGTRMDLDNDDDAMDVASDEDNAIVHATAGGIPPPPAVPRAVVRTRLLSRDNDNGPSPPPPVNTEASFPKLVVGGCFFLLWEGIQ